MTAFATIGDCNCFSRERGDGGIRRDGGRGDEFFIIGWIFAYPSVLPLDPLVQGIVSFVCPFGVDGPCTEVHDVHWLRSANSLSRVVTVSQKCSPCFSTCRLGPIGIMHAVKRYCASKCRAGREFYFKFKKHFFNLSLDQQSLDLHSRHHLKKKFNLKHKT